MVTEGGFNENIVGDDVGQASIKINPLTGLYFSHAFFEQAEVVLKKIKPDTYCMVAVDLEHFRLFNKLYGRAEGDCLLVLISDLLKVYQRKHGGIVGYLGGDNFGILTVYDKELLENLYQKIKDIVNKWNNMVGFLPAFGIYPISETTTSAAAMYDRATVALSHVLGNYVNRMCEYYPDMDEKIEEEIRLLSEIQKALDNEEFIFYVQPQCDITTGKIVGGESLVRWKRGMKAIIPPGIFVPVLERNGFIADLDRYVWERVCKWLREWLDKGNRPVPISINVSRIDMFSMDVPEFLLQLVHKYNVPANLLKIEITESAYAENEKKIIQAVQRLRKEGFLVMMDDFGSGYSSLNMLKSISVDVLKMDMRFLEINEDEEEKGISILDSVINMARQMRIPVIVEGVENQRQENSLLKLECHYAQGYYYYRPMPIGDFEVLISDERKVDYKGIRCRQNESLHTREFLDRNLFNDTMVNNILGPAAFYEMYENNIEITRVNGQYYELAGIEDDIDSDYHKKFWNHVRDDDRQLLYSIFAQAYENPLGGAQGHIHFIRDDEKVLWVYMRVFFLREREGHKIFYGSLTDMTGVHHKHGEVLHIPTKVYKLSQEQMFQMEQYYGNLPCGYGIGKVLLDDAGMPLDYEIVYANKEVARICGGDMERLRYLIRKLFSDEKEQLMNKMYRAAYLGETVECHVYSTLSSRYLTLVLSQFQNGYVSCMVQDATHSYIYENTLNNVMKSFREVYFLHLEDNYCRMIYPDENRLMDRGNYEEVINRHFTTNKILNYDRENVRNFLSLENLKRILRKQDTAEYKYRRSVHGIGEEWCLTTVQVSERQKGIPKTAIITIRSIDALMREQEERKRQNMAEMLANMSEGFFIYQAVGEEKILYANPTVLKIFGCDTMAEFNEMVHHSFKGMVHPEDLNRVEWEIHEQINYSDTNMDYVSYRIVRKDGSIRWIDDCGHLVDTDSVEDANLFYVLISDVTDTITEAQKGKLLALNHYFNQIK